MTNMKLEDTVNNAIKRRDFVQKAFPYRIDLSADNPYLIVCRWCEEQFGKQWGLNNPNGIWTGDILPRHIGYRDWYFKNEKDAVLFALRWA
jgi:hypothetical protein